MTGDVIAVFAYSFTGSLQSIISSEKNNNAVRRFASLHIRRREAEGVVCRLVTHPPTLCASCMGQGKIVDVCYGS